MYVILLLLSQKNTQSPGLAKGSINYKLRTRISGKYIAMPPTGLSATGLMVRLNAKILRVLLEKQPTKYHEAEAKLLWTSIDNFRNFIIKVQKDSNKHLQQCQESRDLYLNAKNAATMISDQHATKCATVTSLTRQLLGMNQPRLEVPQRIALDRQLSDAVIEHDAVLEQMEMMEQEAENSWRSYGVSWREARDSNEYVQRLWDEYEVVRRETKDVMRLLMRLWDEKDQRENEVECEEAVEELRREGKKAMSLLRELYDREL